MAALRIGSVAKRTGVTAPTIRYYEGLGLLSPARRSTAGYRQYTEATVAEVHFIKKAQALGFSLEEIHEILHSSRAGHAPCSRVLDLARRHLAAVDERIRLLSQFRGALTHEIAKWNGVKEPTCEGLCRIIADADANEAETPTQTLLRPLGGRPWAARLR